MIATCFGQVCSAFSAAFLFCDVGQRLSNSFEQVIDTINEFDWYLFPTKVQRMLPTLMIVAQQPVEIIVIGSISSNRYTFENVRTFKFEIMIDFILEFVVF